MKDGKYMSLDQLESDVDLMCRNTQEYNIEGSQIFEDSVTLWNVFSSAKQRLLEHDAQMAKEAREKQSIKDESGDEDENSKANIEDTNDVDMDNDQSDDDGTYKHLHLTHHSAHLTLIEII